MRPGMLLMFQYPRRIQVAPKSFRDQLLVPHFRKKISNPFEEHFAQKILGDTAFKRGKSCTKMQRIFIE